MKAVQFLQVTPEQLQEAIVNGVTKQLEILKSDFQPKQPDELMTRQEVMAFLKIDLSTIHRWTKKGYLIKHGIGNRVYYKRSEIEGSIIQLNGNTPSSQAC